MSLFLNDWTRGRLRFNESSDLASRAILNYWTDRILILISRLASDASFIPTFLDWLDFAENGKARVQPIGNGAGVRRGFPCSFKAIANFVEMASANDSGRFDVQISVPLRELRVRSFDEGSACAL